MPVKRKPDYWIPVLAILLFAFGLVMIFSSSAVLALEKYGDTYYFLKRQTLWGAIGITAMVIAMKIDYRYLMRYSYILYGGTLIALLLVLTPGIGRKVNGAQRWLNLGFSSVQPAEFAKIALIIFFAAILAKKISEGRVGEFSFGFLPCITALILVLSLIQMQPDMGTAIVIATVSIFLFIIAGVRLLYLGGLAVLAAPVLYISVYSVGYRRKRILSFLDPWQDMSDSGYQIIQSYIAMAKGGAFGSGLGESKQKLFYLPEAHTDFIFSIVGEELGLFGGLILMGLLVALAWRGLKTGLNAPDKFGSLLALGITFTFSLQTLINLSVAMGMAPTKGLPLPFVSLGGSALVMWMLSIGILTNVSEHAQVRQGRQSNARQDERAERYARYSTA